MGLDDKIRKDRERAVDAATWLRRLQHEFEQIVAGMGLKKGTYGPAKVPDKDIGDGQTRIGGTDNAMMASNNATARYRIDVDGKPVIVDLELTQSDKDPSGYNVDFADVPRWMLADDKLFYSNIQDELIRRSKS